MSHHTDHHWVAWLLSNLSPQKRWEIDCRISGNSNVHQKMMRIIAESCVIVSGRIHRDCTAHCKVSEYTNTEIQKLAIMIAERYLLVAPVHKIIGSNGKTHGARIVITHATKERRRIHIINRETKCF
jgi:hypothetical protein